uniref:Prion protein n=1 Tax=Denticeps clupeoides TaxID=299321 RepID=A0AAY4AIJ0_9TELE
MGQLCQLAVLYLIFTAVLLPDHILSSKIGKGSSSKTKSSSKGTSTSSKTPNYPRQPVYPNQQNPARGGTGTSYGGNTNMNPGAGGYPQGGNYPGAGGYPNQQYPGRGGYYPGAGGYPNQQNPGQQYPGGGYNPGYPAGGQGWGQAGGYGGGYGGGYPNWNPNNKVLSPHYGGGFGHGGYGQMGGSPFSNHVKNMGYAPSVKSKGFAKKAMLAAGVGAVAGMAVGYGLGRIPRPHFSFRNPQEEYYYNNYMYQRHGSGSTTNNEGGQEYKFNPPPKSDKSFQSYEKYMDSCMKRSDLLDKQGRSVAMSGLQSDQPQEADAESKMPRATPDLPDSSPQKTATGQELTVSPEVPKKDLGPAGIRNKEEEEEDTVSIEEIGYPALIEQLKARRCVELYMAYSEKYAQKQTGDNPSSRSGPSEHPVVRMLTVIIPLLSILLVQ